MLALTHIPLLKICWYRKTQAIWRKEVGGEQSPGVGTETQRSRNSVGRCPALTYICCCSQGKLNCSRPMKTKCNSSRDMFISDVSMWKVSETGMLQTFIIERGEELSQKALQADRWAETCLLNLSFSIWKDIFQSLKITVGQNWDPLTKFIWETNIFNRYWVLRCWG